ncbi:MAG TPA: BrnA antitoxin family protein [Aestuariivirga sp.]|nr:BrnA antitoxin family protein [Aestuariivirga sp.]
MDPADDAPELTQEWFARADLYRGGQLVRRGRPLGSGTKELVSLRLDKKALAAFKATGPGWQSRINDTVVRSARRLAAK